MTDSVDRPVKPQLKQTKPFVVFGRGNSAYCSDIYVMFNPMFPAGLSSLLGNFSEFDSLKQLYICDEAYWPKLTSLVLKIRH